jgi:hypothetical protein
MVGHPADPGGRKSRRDARRPIHPGLPPNPDPADFTMPNALACSNLLRCSIGPVFLALFLGCSAVPPPRPSAPAISSPVPRPTDWRDQVIYFAMLDRFADGGPANNDQGLGEYDPALYGTLLDVHARGRPTADLGHRIRSMMTVHARPHLMPTFVDNHDVDRFLASGSEAALQQALLSIFTLPGIPTIYYGTEQGYTRVRDAMFAGDHGSGGRDRYDTTAPLYRRIAELAALRREHRVLSRGVPTVLVESAAGPGVIGWQMAPAPFAAATARSIRCGWTRFRC